ncbi:adenosylcobinamide-GDP ribazoletransferase [Thermus oshimai]|uniref:Adenosylcobinamide-GDP ribazoletransferase n=1 Tax=Thermus oshimai JL-2 TaxID=751945 RepID=K7R8D4_THEOS|nr:adenosylcobinamide-GDP ribazoletransferase [Thermus oshimai]AFV77299.1 cobalamin-5-phosphate synthase [Thermus oshimai JL-2]
MRALLAAFALLTVLPLGRAFAPEDLKGASAFFPLVGYALGGLLALASLLPLPPGLLGALLLALWLALTGFLHLDGLLDTADALLGAKPREKRLAILKDPHLGAFAFGVGGLYLLLKGQALALLPEPLFLLLLPGFARFAFLPFLQRYPLAHQGMAALVRGGPLLPPFLLALPFPILYPGPALLAFLAAYGVARLALARIGGLTGDVLGAMVALSELAGLLGYALWSALRA